MALCRAGLRMMENGSLQADFSSNPINRHAMPGMQEF
jgi:hypothetical protein